MANNCPFFQTVLSGLTEYTVFFKKLWHTNILKALIVLAPYLIHFLLPVKWATCCQFHLQSPTSSEKLLFFAVALLSAVILKYVDPVWSNYSPALKKWGLFWICPVLPSFCGSVIPSPFRWKYTGYLVGATPLTVFHGMFWNSADVFCMEWRCACGFGIILWLFYLTFSAL